MALIEQTMTEKNLAAHQRNAQQSHGAATPEGKERARAANLRHGYYSELRDQALVALGEDPEGLAALAEGARQQFRPANAYQEWITGRISSLQWRIQRAERLQESKAAAHIRRTEAKRREAAEELRAGYADVQDFLESLRRAVARPDFYTPDGCLELCRDVREKNPSTNMDEIHDLLCQLRFPASFSTPAPPALPGAMSDEEWNDELAEETNDESPGSRIPVAEGSDRDPLREKLWNLADAELHEAAESWQKAIAAKEAPLSARARDLLVAEMDKDLELLRREERSCVREFSRLGNELRKLRKEAAEPQAQAKTSDQPSQAQSEAEDAEAGNLPADCGVDLGSTPRRWEAAATVAATAARDARDAHKNAGASGYVEENTSKQPRAAATKRPSAPTQAQADGQKWADPRAEAA
jgi:hypothetical protein